MKDLLSAIKERAGDKYEVTEISKDVNVTMEDNRETYVDLHYAEMILNADIPCYRLKIGDNLDSFVLGKHNDDMVILVSIGDAVFVTNHILEAIDFYNLFFKSNRAFYDLSCLFIQEYLSFEEAYKVALSMQEIHSNCYEN